MVVLGAIAGSAIGAISSGPLSPVPANSPMSHKQGAAKPGANTLQPDSKSASGMGASTVGKSDAGESGVLRLMGMPTGTVRVWRDSQGKLEAQLAVYGLTPGSSHDVSIDAPNSTPVSPEVRFPAFTADRTGRANVALTATSAAWGAGERQPVQHPPGHLHRQRRCELARGGTHRRLGRPARSAERRGQRSAPAFLRPHRQLRGQAAWLGEDRLRPEH